MLNSLAWDSPGLLISRFRERRHQSALQSALSSNPFQTHFRIPGFPNTSRSYLQKSLFLLGFPGFACFLLHSRQYTFQVFLALPGRTPNSRQYTFQVFFVLPSHTFTNAGFYKVFQVFLVFCYTPENTHSRLSW